MVECLIYISASPKEKKYIKKRKRRKILPPGKGREKKIPPLREGESRRTPLENTYREILLEQARTRTRVRGERRGARATRGALRGLFFYIQILSSGRSSGGARGWALSYASIPVSSALPCGLRQKLTLLFFLIIKACRALGALPGRGYV